MTDPKIQQICDGLSVCVGCYEKLQKYFGQVRNQCCHVCFEPCPDYDFCDLSWIGDEQVICCGKDSCKIQIRKLDDLVAVLSGPKTVTQRQKYLAKENEDG